MLTKERTHTGQDKESAREFYEPQAWLGHVPAKPVKVCFAATNVEAWEAGTEAVVSWRGKRFRIVCEGKDVPQIQTARGILVGE